MSDEISKEYFDETLGIHQEYLGILNCLPDIVYWVDKDCLLKGCNQNFIKLLGLKKIKDLKGTPYEQMAKYTGWPEKNIEAFKLDDMKVLFSGEPQWDVEEGPLFNKDKKVRYYRTRRVPLFDKDNKVHGLVVVLTDITKFKKMEEQLQKVATKEKIKPSPAKRIEEPKILMVEDNFVAQKVEEALLKELQCQVDIADTGDKALNLFDPGKYDMVFMDIGLEDTSGYLVAKKIRQKEQNTNYHVPIIALTSYQADVVKYDVEDYFMDGVLTKPLTSEQADQLIKHFVHKEDIMVSGLKSAREN
ncbi:TPA: response regulator [Legionella pneumophila subsp. pneumophila]|uniref:response regulator n=1 Tax=Legionella pneumophila TaxID=446 RepID=UPI000D7CC5D8|nr:response regulator [Legionella pneumophila]HAT9491738.1 response regulator [Legionella pneumophila subsp. pneumophila]PYB43401.1 response regulator [Legionella pneumophila]PYB49439.1 response regulator [Legionella pneumophila]PYB62190.1 response regulator [Legionella pneumophila]TID58236.1 response regulator [Legionella pneumophila]